MGNKNSTIYMDEKEKIDAFVQSRSTTMYEYMMQSNSQFTLWYKTLAHSDLTNRGKKNGLNEGLEKNYLYYLSVEEMEKIQEQFPEKPFESAKQSNIGLPTQFYGDLGVPRLERRKGKQETQHAHVLVNEYADVMFVNDTIEFFTQEYTARVLKRLNKYNRLFCSRNDVTLNEKTPFTEIQLTEAIHGLGTADDVEFHKLRLSMFLNDTVIFLIEHRKEKNRLYIMLEKNPRFFTLANVADTAWEKYIATHRRQEVAKIKGKEPLSAGEDEKSRRLQSAWKDKLAKEMMTYTTEEGKVFCPITNICADFSAFSMLFVASHIKRHVDCSNDKESFDVNNGLLLSANADALFDKYMITINEEKELVFSFLLEPDYKLRSELLLNSPIFKLVLNEARMKNLEEHRKIFYKKEEERKRTLSR
ncbi:HNH endonuclease signature motif containing protein [Anaerorhabdus sp.]|uniref:HNH endonuclease signature motif containing protein n=1 Tax=Anaerorhabdus sp. TaxID=1872524 RepID=UPI002FC80815